jgi:hypothetical protein
MSLEANIRFPDTNLIVSLVQQYLAY